MLLLLGSLSAQPCADAPSKSPSSQTQTDVTFENRSGGAVTVHWRNYEGSTVKYASLDDGATTTQSTYSGHVWEVRNASGTCIATFVAGSSKGTAAISGPAKAEPAKPPPSKGGTKGPAIGAPPASLKLPAFYEKYLDADGLPVVSSSKVSDEGLRRAHWVVANMLANNKEILARLGKRNIRVAIMAPSEVTTDIPEHADLNEAFPGTDWNARTRGVGATPQRPASTAGEENVLCLEQDRYRGESILVHEFAHTVMTEGIMPFDSNFRPRVDAAFKAARDAGLWNETYAATDVLEYWAEGVQSWFDSNASAQPANGVHNHVDTRAELLEYDPTLAALVKEVFGDTAWRFSCP